MKNSKLVAEAKLNPTGIYQRPHDVLRDRRLGDIDRLEILAAWEREGGGAAADTLDEIRRARSEVEARLSDPRAAE